MSQHTPGPWTVREIEGAFHGSKAYAIDFNEDQEQVVDYVYTEADANLISAAPDLLDALERITTAYADEMYSERSCKEKDLPEVVAARKVIARARGDQ